MMRTLTIILTLLVAGAPALAGRITLRSSARIESGAAALRDVAHLKGPEAEALGDVVIVEDLQDLFAGRAWASIDIDRVREALEERDVNWGRVTLRGSECTLRRAGGAEPVRRAERSEAPAPAPRVVSLDGPETIRSRVARLIARLFGVENESLRLEFDENDRDLLDLPTRGRRVEVQPGGTASSARLPVVIWIYEGERLAESRTIQVDVVVRRRALILTRDLDRDERITQDVVRSEVMWLAPQGDPPVSALEQADGAVTRRRLSGGDILRAGHLESPVVIERNQLVTVHCISGGVVVKTRARAMHDAREGEPVELRLGRERKSFVATAAGPGRAIVNMDARTGEPAHDKRREETS